MDIISLFIVLSTSLFFSVRGEMTLTFNTTKFENSDVYYADVGATVSLTCVVPSALRRVSIYKSTILLSRKWKYIKLVDRGNLLTRNVVVRQGKYSNEAPSLKNNYVLVIHNLTRSDTSSYKCKTKVKTCSSRSKYGNGIICRIKWKQRTVSLAVKNNSGKPILPEFCYLVNDTNGMYIVGDDLTMRCPKNVSIIVANKSRIDVSEKDDGKYFNLLTIGNLTENISGKMITCFCSQNAAMGEDYCSRLPVISVFPKLTVNLSPIFSRVRKGEQASFICQSHPFLEDAFEWDIPEDDTIYGNVTITQTLNGSKLLIDNISFRNPASSLPTVVCTVTIGSRKKSQTATVYPNRSTNTTKNGENNESSRKASFVIPVIVSIVLLLIGTIVAGFFYLKVGKNATRKAEIKNVTFHKEFENVERKVYQSECDIKTKLGLTANDSEVMENVAYVSFNEVYQQN